MTGPDDSYEAWKRHRADVPVPEDFADRVQAAVRRRQRWSLLRSRAARVALCSLAGAVWLCRLLQFVVPFVSARAGL
jgi:hypothetical protein